MIIFSVMVGICCDIKINMHDNVIAQVWRRLILGQAGADAAQSGCFQTEAPRPASTFITPRARQHLSIESANLTPSFIMPGFDFSNHTRNAALHAKGFPLPKATSTGTTIVGCIFDGGVVIAAGTHIVKALSFVMGYSDYRGQIQGLQADRLWRTRTVRSSTTLRRTFGVQVSTILHLYYLHSSFEAPSHGLFRCRYCC